MLVNRVNLFIIPFVYCCLTGISPLLSQTIYFSKTFDNSNSPDGGNAVVVTNDGGYLAIGEALKNGTRYLFFVRTDKSGDTVWTREYGNPIYVYTAGLEGSLIKTIDSCYVLCGAFWDTTDYTDALLLKFNDKGEILWEKTYGGKPYHDYFYGCKQTRDGGYIALGITDNFGVAGSRDYYLVKTDSSGNELWYKTYGGNQQDGGTSIEVTSEGGFIIGGGSDSYGMGITDTYIIKTDSLGNIQWSKTYGTPKDDCGGDIKLYYDNTYIMWSCIDTIIKIGAEQQYVNYIAKLDSIGNILWKTFFPNKYSIYITNLQILNNGNIIVIGYIETEISPTDPFGWICSLDSDGKKLWERTYYTRTDLDNYFLDIEQTSAGGFIITGNAFDVTSDIWLLKLDSMGCLVSGCDTITGDIEIPFSPELQLSIYPNPVSYNKQVQLNYFIATPHKNIEIIISDIFGRTIKTYPVYQFPYGNILIDVTNFSTGIYSANLNVNNTLIYSTKLIIAH